MFLSTLKFLQLLTGIVLTGLFLAAPALMPLRHPDMFSIASASDFYTNNYFQLLLAIAAANLMAGCYQVALPAPRKPLQVLASLGFLAAGIISVASTLGHPHVYFAMGILSKTCIVLLLVSLGLHLLCNLHLLNPAARNRETFGSANSPMKSANREKGTVKWFNVSKGFGFITRDSGEDIFVHYRSIRGKGHRILFDGQRVSFVVAKNEKGLQAEDVAVQG